MRHNRSIIKSDGFTIVELMIATSVLSTMLVFVTVIMISIGNLYYKGVNQTRVQDAVRTIAEDVSQHLQLTDSTAATVSATSGSNTLRAYCIGETRYSYTTGIKINTSGIKHVLWRDKVNNGCAPADLTSNNPSATTGVNTVLGSEGVELIPDNSRVTFFDVLGSSPYTIGIGVAFGDDDLLTGTGANTLCGGNTGDHFCATASLNTVAVKRLIPQTQ